MSTHLLACCYVQSVKNEVMSLIEVDVVGLIERESSAVTDRDWGFWLVLWPSWCVLYLGHHILQERGEGGREGGREGVREGVREGERDGRGGREGGREGGRRGREGGGEGVREGGGG